MSATAAGQVEQRHRGFWVLLATILGSSMVFIDGSALTVAVPALQSDLDATGAEVLWINNAYLLLLASLLLIGGALGDRFGRVRVYGLGILIFSAASLLCGLAPDTSVLIAARALQGIGGALMVPGSLAIIAASFPPDQRGQAIGTWSAFSTFTTLGGPALGGFLVEADLWRAIFFINVPLAAIALFALRRVPETRNPDAPRQPDLLGALLVALGLAGIVYGAVALGEGSGVETIGGIPPLVYMLAGVVILAAFVWVESRSDHPMIPLTIFRSHTFSGANLMTAFLYAGLTGALFFLPLNLQQVQGYSPSIAGFTLLPFGLLLAVMSPWAGGLVPKYGPRLPLTVGPAIVGLGFLALALPGLTDGASDYFTTYFPAIVLTGVGMGITVAPLSTAVMGSLPPEQAGIASGVNNAITRSAQVVAIAIMGGIALSVFSSRLDDRTADLALSDDQRAALAAEAGDLGDAQPPETMDTAMTDAVQGMIDQSFVDMFRVLALIAAGLAFLSAGLAALTIDPRLSPPGDAAQTVITAD